jgi:phage shock protein C
VAVALALSGGAGLLLYVIAWIAIPEDTPGALESRPAAADGPEVEASRERSRTAAVTIAGGALVVAGALMLLNRLVPWLDAALVWPLIVVAVGVAILTSGRRRT